MTEAETKLTFDDETVQLIRDALTHGLIRDYAETARLFVGSILHSLMIIGDKTGAPWAKKALDDYKGFTVRKVERAGHIGRDFLDQAIGNGGHRIWEYFPDPIKWNTEDVTQEITIVMQFEYPISVVYGIDVKSQAPYIMIQPANDCPTDNPYYALFTDAEMRLHADEVVDVGFKTWFASACVSFILTVAKTRDDDVKKSTLEASIRSIGALFHTSYQSFIKEYLVKQVFVDERGYDRENIVKEHGVPDGFIDLDKFIAGGLDIAKNFSDVCEVYDASFQVIGCNVQNVPAYMFDVGLRFKNDHGKIELFDQTVKLFDIDSVNETLHEIAIVKGTLLCELIDAYFTAHSGNLCAALSITYDFYAQNKENSKFLHVRSDETNAKGVGYRKE